MIQLRQGSWGRSVVFVTGCAGFPGSWQIFTSLGLLSKFRVPIFAAIRTEPQPGGRTLWRMSRCLCMFRINEWSSFFFLFFLLCAHSYTDLMENLFVWKARGISVEISRHCTIVYPRVRSSRDSHRYDVPLAALWTFGLIRTMINTLCEVYWFFIANTLSVQGKTLNI